MTASKAFDGPQSGQPSIDGPHIVQSKVILLEPSALTAALADLWHQRLLCDIVLRTATTRLSSATPASTDHGTGHGPGPPARTRHDQHRQAVACCHSPTQISSCSLAETAAASAENGADDYGETETVEGVSVKAVAGDGAVGSGAVNAACEAGPDEEIGDVEDLPAHRVVLAATCDYFRALLAGAGAAMSDMRAATAAGAAAAAAATADGGPGGSGGEGPHGTQGLGTNTAPAVAVVSLPGVDGWALRLAVGALYERRVEVAADNLEGLISAASYLGAAALLDACAAFMRSNLGLQTCLPLLLLAWRYNMGPLRDELMSYVCRRFSVLVRTRLSADGAAGCPGPGGELRLSSLPLELLLEVLRSEELLAECESDVLQCALEWLAEQYLMDNHPHGSGTSVNNNNHGGSGSSCSSRNSIAAIELVRLVHWSSLPDPPHLHLTRGSLSSRVHALGGLLEAHAHEYEAQGAEAAAGSARAVGLPPAVLRLRKLLAELQTAARPDLAPAGVVSVLSPSGTPRAAAAAAFTGTSDAMRRVGAVAPSARCGRDIVGGGRPRRHLASGLLAAGGHGASWRAVKAVEMYDPRNDQWVAGPSLLQGFSFTGSAMVPSSSLGAGFGSGSKGLLGSCGAVYLVGGTPLCSSVWQLPWGPDGPVVRSWELGPPLLMPRAHAGVVAVAGTLTVLGGRSQVQQVQHVLNSVEMLTSSASSDTAAAAMASSPFLPASSFAIGCWTRGPDMVQPRSAHACAVLGGRVFALGGAGAVSGGTASAGGAGGPRGGAGGGGAGGTHRSGEFLDLGSGRWQLLGCDMEMARKYTAAAAHGGRIYVAGGVNESRTRLSSLEALDPREGRWSTLEPMSAPRSSHGMAALGSCLYVAGGQCNSADVAASAAAGAGGGMASAWGWGPSPGRQQHPLHPIGSLGMLGSSPPAMYGIPYGRVSTGSAGVYGSAPGPSGGWAVNGAALGMGMAFSVGVGAGSGGGGGGGVEEMTVLASMECYDVAAGRWRVCAPLGHGGRAGLALCAA